MPLLCELPPLSSSSSQRSTISNHFVDFSAPSISSHDARDPSYQLDRTRRSLFIPLPSLEHYLFFVASVSQVLSREIRNVLSVGGPARSVEIKFGNWREKLSQSGFRDISLAKNAHAQATLLLGIFPSDGFTLMEENGTLKLGWKDLSLLTVSAWKPIQTPAKTCVGYRGVAW
ncbi:hypothetical protein KFK09_024276 [Dendrobium nobile]|uniref:Uncharacterized protein n=1 Tax=Dendrobium nobile TaxID=94219 RepID=A0A8T3AIZ5_DENNO|nr:hypothetical protein KFK09_024276 [Dendrobium nobile]